MISHSDPRAIFSPAPASVATTHPLTGRILVIDDDEVVLNVVGRALRAAGFQVLSATSGEEGLERFTALKPDCALVDVYLPGLDGFAFVERARAISPEVPMLMLSGLDGSDHERKARQAGARRFLQKGIDIRDLEKHIRDVMAAANRDESPLASAAPFILPTLDLAELERAAIAQALGVCRGNRTKAARLLGIHVRTLHRKLGQVELH